MKALEELRRLLDAASKAPWTQSGMDRRTSVRDPNEERVAECLAYDREQGAADAALIVAMRTSIDDLLTLAEALHDRQRASEDYCSITAKKDPNDAFVEVSKRYTDAELLIAQALFRLEKKQ